MNVKYFVIYYASRVIPDKIWLKTIYRLKMKHKLNLSNPKTFNEKLQWLKLYDRNPLYTTMVDKAEAKGYVADRIGEEHIIPTLGVWDSVDDINFDALPNQFVLKCTHDSGGLVICKDKKTLDLDAVREKLRRALKRKYFYWGREWPYKNVKPRILAEKYMVDESGDELKDYKVFCFNGEAKLIQVDFGRFKKHMRNLYSTNWDYVEGEIEYPSDKTYKISRPEALDQMLRMAERLSRDIPHVRTDFYSIGDQIYFGEMTFYHGSGFEHFRPEELGIELGQMISLPRTGGGYC